MEDARRTRMFPLGTVLFPLGVLPLHIFEPRYLTMIGEALEDDSTFGVTLIEKGPEVGGGDRRHAVGTLARVVRAGRIDDARLAIVTVGVTRIRVTDWLREDPYPAAMVEMYPDGDVSRELGPLVAETRRMLRRLMAFASELGADVGTMDIDLPEDVRKAVWTLCSMAPIEQLDRQRLLEIADPQPRIEELQRLLADTTETLQARLAEG